MRTPLLVTSLALLAAPGQAQSTWRVSVDSSGVEAASGAASPSISSDAALVAYDSDSDNLVPGDTNGMRDVFVHEVATGVTTRVSVSSTGVQGDGDSRSASLSQDGRWVVFHSAATNLVPGDTNGALDVFVHDRVNGTTERVSLTNGGAQANGASYVNRFGRSISADGHHVVLASDASNLVSGDTNGSLDVFVRDRVQGTTTRVSVDSLGNEAAPGFGSLFASISADGGRVAFQSHAGNLVSGDTNGLTDVFVHDLLTLRTERVSVPASSGETAYGSFAAVISGDGDSVAFVSRDRNLVVEDVDGFTDVFVRDLVTSTTERVSVTTHGGPADAASVSWGLLSSSIDVSHDGRLVAFPSLATNLAPADTNGIPNHGTGWDVYLRDRELGRTTRVSVDSTGMQANDRCYSPSLAADGHTVVFGSAADNLVPGDTNAAADVFVHVAQPAPGQALTTCVAAPNSTGAGAAMTAFGSFSVGANDLTLLAAGMPAGVGQFWFGSHRGLVPFGDGFRCVLGTTGRVAAPAPIGAGGSLLQSFDIAAFAGLFEAGTNWNFQLFYRDGASFNTTDTVSLTFAP